MLSLDSSRIFASFTILVIIFTATSLWLYNYIRRNQSLWKKYGVTEPETHIFLIGAEWELSVKSWADTVMERFKKYGKLYGCYQLLRPVLYVHDPEMLKSIMVKDFHCFTDQTKIRTYHEHFNQSLFFSEGQKWKRMRTIASPSFTSGKLRNMSSKMNYCVDKLLNYFDKIQSETEGKIQTKTVIAGFTIDVIASCGFSTETDCNDDRKEEGPFIKNALKLFAGSEFRAFLALTLPRSILNLINVRTLIDPKAFDYFLNMIKEIIRQRKSLDSKDSKKSNDLLQLMLDAEVDEKEIRNDNFDNLTASMDNSAPEIQESSKVDGKHKLTPTEVIANSIFFMIAGFETTSSTISHSLFQLAWNQDIQERLYKELKQAISDKDIHSTEFYETVVHGIPFLEACIKEVMRLYPPVPILTRTVTVDEYNLNGIPLPRDAQIFIPVYAIHHDEDFYKNPFKFDPDRWMPENKDLLVPYTYMPFGLGPRNCLGMRFAYQEIRICLARMIMKYRFEITSNTPKELTYAPRSPLLLTSPFELKISKRNA